MNKINIKFSNIVGILLTICVISIILYPWCKQNIEKFVDTSTTGGSSTVLIDNSGSTSGTGTVTGGSVASSQIVIAPAAPVIDSSTSGAGTAAAPAAPVVNSSTSGTGAAAAPAAPVIDSSTSGAGTAAAPAAPVVNSSTSGTGAAAAPAAPAITSIQPVKPIDTNNYKTIDPPPLSYLNSSEQLKTIYDTILNNRLEVNNYLNRIQLLRDNLHEKGTVSIDDYKKLINDINDAFTKKSKDTNLKGALQIKKALNDDTIKNITDQIDVLNNQFLTLNTLSLNDGNSSAINLNINIINSIKTAETGINLNVKHLNSNDFNKEDYKPKIMIFLNNGCLTYKESENKYIAKHCEMTNKLQYFILKKIKDGTDYLNHLTSDYYKQQELINKNSDAGSYPFNIIYPIDNIKKCVKVDLDGLSIEECKPTKINLDQRWLSSHLNIKSCD